MTGIDDNYHFYATPAVDDSGNVYAGTKLNMSSGGIMYCIKSDGSGLLWQYDLGCDLYSSPALAQLGSQRLLLVCSEQTHTGSSRNFELHAFDLGTGELLGSGDLGADVTWSSLAIANGIIYVSTMCHGENDAYYGYVRGLKINSDETLQYLPGAGSPRFHQGNESTGRQL